MDQSNSTMVRISDFCKRRHRHRERNYVDASKDESFLNLSNFELNNTSIAKSLMSSGGIPLPTHVAQLVSVSILKSLPSLNYGLDSNASISDEYATIYTEDVQLLLALQVFDGQICMLNKVGMDKESISKNIHTYEGGNSIPVIITVVPEGTFSSNSESETIESESSHLHPRGSPNYGIHVPPNIAISMGVHEYGYLSLKIGARIIGVQMNMAHANISKHDSLETVHGIPTAQTAKIIEISSPPDDFMQSLGSIFPSSDDAAKSVYQKKQNSLQIEGLQQYFYRKKCGGKSKNEAALRLMTVGSIFGIIDESCEVTPSDRFSMKIRANVRFYKIVELGLKNLNVVSATPVQRGHENFCWVSPETQLTLIPQAHKHDQCVLRMTQLSSMWMFRKSIQELAAVDYYSFMKMAWSHPSLTKVVETILSIGNIGVSLNRHSDLSLQYHLIHLLGHKDDHIELCLDAAADSVGMNIIHVDGLASFAHRYKTLQLGETEGSIVGSIMDKIDGIQAAFAIGRRCTPCILHFCFDEEIIATDDVDARHDEERRLLACIREELSDIYNVVKGFDATPVFVIFSTEKEFQHGPLSSSILYDSISIESPNDTYARELWNDNDTYDELKSEILGRSANEIHFLGRRFLEKKHEICTQQTSSPFVAKLALASILKSEDKVAMFNNSTKKLASDLIPNVKWEDIGGLSHVRDEIIDAIELPLQHPHLFEGSGRRSGILFFGPPGSGKTLVAKAVASECGLPFLSVKGPELLGSYVGESEANIRAAFKSAREAAAEQSRSNNSVGAAILFFDEIDSLAPRRGELGDGGGVMERVVSTLLAEMDRKTDKKKLDKNMNDLGHVFVIGATNRPDLLDPSLLRPGRFDRTIYLGLATRREDRIQILAAQTRKFQFENNVDAHTMATKVIDSIHSSMSGADFSAIASGALMSALQRLCNEVDREVSLSANGDPDYNIEDVVESWGEEKLHPKVRVEDFIVAAENVNPSVSVDDIRKYELMRDEYCTANRHSRDNNS